jgi:hypothetical protein
MTTSRIPFSEADHKRLARLASWTSVVAGFHGLFAALCIVGSALGAVALPFVLAQGTFELKSAVSFAVLFPVGVLLAFQASTLNKARASIVVAGREGGFTHIADALARIRRFFLLEAIASAFGIVSAVVSAVWLVGGGS